MNKFEVEKKEVLDRKEVATRLRHIANILATEGDEVEFERDGMEFKVAIPERVNLKLELELGDDENELEIELTW